MSGQRTNVLIGETRFIVRDLYQGATLKGISVLALTNNRAYKGTYCEEDSQKEMAVRKKFNSGRSEVADAETVSSLMHRCFRETSHTPISRRQIAFNHDNIIVKNTVRCGTDEGATYHTEMTVTLYLQVTQFP